MSVDLETVLFHEMFGTSDDPMITTVHVKLNVSPAIFLPEVLTSINNDAAGKK